MPSDIPFTDDFDALQNGFDTAALRRVGQIAQELDNLTDIRSDRWGRLCIYLQAIKDASPDAEIEFRFRTVENEIILELKSSEEDSLTDAVREAIVLLKQDFGIRLVNANAREKT